MGKDINQAALVKPFEMDKTEIIIITICVIYCLIGTALAFFAYHKDKEANKLVASACVPFNVWPVIMINIVILLWPLWLLFYYIFKDDIEKAEDNRNKDEISNK